jgi:hypothetical protein
MNFKLGSTIKVGHQIKTAKGWRNVLCYLSQAKVQ